MFRAIARNLSSFVAMGGFTYSTITEIARPVRGNVPRGFLIGRILNQAPARRDGTSKYGQTTLIRRLSFLVVWVIHL